jgi:oligoribonuclease NrnB/cAMP/cGMP phosphodiesterase (DHH superfamily)
MKKQIKRLGIYHSKDTDGHFSGAVLKYKYPDIELRGWDYKDEVPSFESMNGYDEIILIDITFPFDILQELGTRTKLTVIDHHVSFKKQVDNHLQIGHDVVTDELKSVTFEYIYDDKLSACELGFQHYFGYIPPIVELVGKYDTWRANGTNEWEETVLPMKYYLYGKVNKPEDVKNYWFDSVEELYHEDIIDDMLEIGKSIMEYERKMDESKTNSYAFEREVYGLRALCINTNFMSSETMMTKFDSSKHDIMIGFAYNGNNWGVSLRSVGDKVDVSQIAKARFGGGHKNAAGFQAVTFEDIFK